MSSVTKPAGTNGTFTYSLNQVPYSAPTLIIYSDSARTQVAVSSQTLTATSNPAVFTATYPATLAAATYYLSFSTVFTQGQSAVIDNDDTLVLVPVVGNVSSPQTPAAVATYATPYAPPVAYLTPAEYKSAPTAVDVSQLTLGGTGQSEDAELWNVIRRASAWANSFCNQVLAATVDVEVAQCIIDRQGRIKIHPDFWPVLEIRDFEYGSTPNSLTALSDLSNVWLTRQYLYVHLGVGMTSSSQGPLAFSSSAPGSKVYARYTYVNGWPNCLLAFNATAGSNSIQVTDATGIYGSGSTTASNSALPAATKLTIFDGADTEAISVQSVAANTLTLNTPLQYNHSALISVSALPFEIKQAVILLTSALIKTRGSEAIIMGRLGERPQKVAEEEAAGVEDAMVAFEFLDPFRRIR